VAILLFISCASDDKGGLQEEVQSLQLNYVSWACPCANWVTYADLNKYYKNISDSLPTKGIFVEPASSSLELPDTLGYNGDVIRFTGQFYNKKGYPNNETNLKSLRKGRVFKYTDFEVVKSNYAEVKKLNNSH